MPRQFGKQSDIRGEGSKNTSCTGGWWEWIDPLSEGDAHIQAVGVERIPPCCGATVVTSRHVGWRVRGSGRSTSAGGGGKRGLLQGWAAPPPRVARAREPCVPRSVMLARAKACPPPSPHPPTPRAWFLSTSPLSRTLMAKISCVSRWRAFHKSRPCRRCERSESP